MEKMKNRLKTIPIVFAGPSISKEEIEEIADGKLDIREPIKRHDLDTIGPEQEVIAIIDGVFLSQLAVSAREILILLKKGFTILGSSSMGALRAAELDAYGMIGIGSIYNMYKEKQIQSDDEVALIFTPENYRLLSEPLVNIRYSVGKAMEAGIMDSSSGGTVIEIAKSIYFPKLNYDILFYYLDQVLDKDIVIKYKMFISQNRKKLDLKNQDAIKLIQYMNDTYFK